MDRTCLGKYKMDQKWHGLILTEAINESTMVDQSHFVGPDL